MLRHRRSRQSSRGFDSRTRRRKQGHLGHLGGKNGQACRLKIAIAPIRLKLFDYYTWYCTGVRSPQSILLYDVRREPLHFTGPCGTSEYCEPIAPYPLQFAAFDWEEKRDIASHSHCSRYDVVGGTLILRQVRLSTVLYSSAVSALHISHCCYSACWYDENLSGRYPLEHLTRDVFTCGAFEGEHSIQQEVCQQLRVVSTNVTSARGFYDFLGLLDKQEERPHVVLVQEHKLFGSKLATAKKRLLGLKWAFTFVEAQVTSSGGISSGTAVLWKPWIEARQVLQVSVPHRLSVVDLCLKPFGIVRFCSYYGYVAGTWQAHHVPCLTELAKLTSQPFPVIVGGDFNLDSHIVDSWSKQLGAPLQVITDGSPTCYTGDKADKTIDFFYVSPVLSLVASTTTVKYAEVATHSSVWLTLNSAALSEMVPVWRKQPRPRALPVVGPHFESYSDHWALLRDGVLASELYHECAAQPLQFATTQQIQALGDLVGKWHSLAALEARHRFGYEGQPGAGFEVEFVRVSSLFVVPHGASEHGSHKLARTRNRLTQASSLWQSGRQLQAAIVLRNQCSHSDHRHLATIDSDIANHIGLLATAVVMPAKQEVVVRGFQAARDAVESALHKAHAEEKRVGNESWREFVEAALQGGASLAHQLTKAKPVQESFDEEVQLDGAPTTSLRQAITHYSEQWGSQWQRFKEQLPIQWQGLSHLPRLTVQQLKEAAGSFPQGTSTPCGWSPKMWSALSSDALEIMVALMLIYEALGDVGGQEAMLLFRLLLKPQGGRRPIALYRCFFQSVGQSQEVTVEAVGYDPPLQYWYGEYGPWQENS